MLIRNMEMDLKYITAHSGRIITRDLVTQPYPFLNVFFNYLGYWLFFCVPVPRRKKTTVIPMKTVITITTNRTNCYLIKNMQF